MVGEYGHSRSVIILHTSFMRNVSKLIYDYTTLSQTTNFRLLRNERLCRRQFQIFLKWQRALHMGRKHCGKRRNCLL